MDLTLRGGTPYNDWAVHPLMRSEPHRWLDAEPAQAVELGYRALGELDDNDGGLFDIIGGWCHPEAAAAFRRLHEGRA